MTYINLILLIPIAISFFLTLWILPKWIKKCKETDLLWEDMNKPEHPKNVASSGGLVVVMAFVIGVLIYIAIRTFIRELSDGPNLEIFALLSTILMLAVIGLTDDLLGWKNKGLSKRLRLLLALLASIPLVVINAGAHTVLLPFIGAVNFGILYPLLLIPLGIAGASMTYNLLAGFNGLEAGQGILIIGFLSFVAYTTGNPWLAFVGLVMVVSLIIFYFYNKFPAKVFPGDILTYSVGAMIAIMAILGNFEKVALFVFIPYIIETILKLRGGLKKHSFGKPNKDGSLEMPYDKIYGLTHFSIFILKKLKKKVYERDVVYFIFAIQVVFILLAFLIL
jgi:UDP-N-acetylglucosamine--dolichyl-phosphate N-acetylglucosaminephosphotransferase